MTSFRSDRFAFDKSSVEAWSQVNGRHRTWPVVYTLDSSNSVYVGESLNAAMRFERERTHGLARLVAGYA